MLFVGVNTKKKLLGLVKKLNVGMIENNILKIRSLPSNIHTKVYIQLEEKN